MTQNLNGVKVAIVRSMTKQKTEYRKEFYMPYKYNKLRGRIIEKYGTMATFADVLGLSLVSVSKKMNGRTQFSQNDIVKWADLLEIESSEYPAYFLLNDLNEV